jgi:plasmid stabilization system protein ParE
MPVASPMANVAFHPAAQREYQTAISWYQQRSDSAARRFVAEVERVVAVIAAHPDRYGFYEGPYREAGLQRRYPFSIIYRVEASGDVLILAVAHASREPGYWQDRA